GVRLVVDEMPHAHEVVGAPRVGERVPHGVRVSQRQPADDVGPGDPGAGALCVLLDVAGGGLQVGGVLVGVVGLDEDHAGDVELLQPFAHVVDVDGAAQ